MITSIGTSPTPSELEEDDPEDDVEQAEQPRRREHPDRQAGIASVGAAFHGASLYGGGRRCRRRALNRASTSNHRYRLRPRAPPRPARDPAAAARWLPPAARRSKPGGKVDDADARRRWSGPCPKAPTATVAAAVQERRPGRRQGRLHRAAAAAAATRSRTPARTAPSARTSTRRSRRSRSPSLRVTHGQGRDAAVQGHS